MAPTSRVGCQTELSPKASASWLALGCPLSSLVWYFEVVSDANLTSARRRPSTTSTTIGAALAPIESRRRAHRRRQTTPPGAAMKLFAYEHPSGPVHEVEVTLGDTAHWRRLRRSNASTRPRRHHVDASAAPSRATAAGPPAQIQDRAGHADFGAGIRFHAAIDATLSP